MSPLACKDYPYLRFAAGVFLPSAEGSTGAAIVPSCVFSDGQGSTAMIARRKFGLATFPAAALNGPSPICNRPRSHRACGHSDVCEGATFQSIDVKYFFVFLSTLWRSQLGCYGHSTLHGDRYSEPCFGVLQLAFGFDGTLQIRKARTTRGQACTLLNNCGL